MYLCVMSIDYASFHDLYTGFCNCSKSVVYFIIHYISFFFQEPGWLNELGNWITKQLIQVYHQYGLGSRPAL
jgi:hypothetical protein